MRVIKLLAKHLLLVLFVFAFVALAMIIGLLVSEPIVAAMARVLPRIKPSAGHSMLIEVIFFIIALLGLVIGVGVLVAIYRESGESKLTSIRSLLPLVAAVVGVTLGMIGGAMIGESWFWASLPGPDPTGMSERGGVNGFGAIFASVGGAAIGFLTMLIISVVLLTSWEYRQSCLEEEVLSLPLNSSHKSE